MRYRTIVADPPWTYEGFIPSHTPSTGKQKYRPLPYSMMSLEEIRDLPVSQFADRSCRLFLWTTNRYLPHAFGIASAWGFRYAQTLVWRKTGRVAPIGGCVAPNHAEYLLVCRKGSPPITERLPSCVIEAPRGDHSAKPEVFLDLIERCSPGPYLEMFARRNRIGWDTWGNEALNHVEIGA